MAKKKFEKMPHFAANENDPPHHTQFVVGDDNWNLAETALPVTHPKVSSHPGDAIAEGCGQTNAMRPIYSDSESAYIERTHTNGKRR